MVYAILNIITHTFDNIHQKHYIGIFFLDLKKAFDTVSHEILLDILEHYGIRGPAHKLKQSFLKREQYVSIKRKNSRLRSNSFGVPQGSTLGPLLFSLYVNDVPKSEIITPRLFADDTCLLLHHPNPSVLQNNLNHEISIIYKWCIEKS